MKFEILQEFYNSATIVRSRFHWDQFTFEIIWFMRCSSTFIANFIGRESFLFCKSVGNF